MSLEKGPQNPPGPAFEEARNERDAWRRQQITAMTPEQRREHETFKQEQDRKIENKRVELRAGERDQTIEKMHHYLRQNPKPELKPGKGKAVDPDAQRLHDAVPDFVDGRVTNETKALEPRLRPALVASHLEIAREQAAGLKPLQAELQKDYDKLLDRFSAERMSHEKSQGLQGQGWREAVLKAAKQEAALDKDRDLTKDFNERAR